jgi:hypothetical protein
VWISSTGTTRARWNSKIDEFSHATVTDLWEGGHNDVRRAISNLAWQRVTDIAEGIRIFDLGR